MRNSLILAAVVLVVFVGLAFSLGRNAEAVVAASNESVTVTGSDAELFTPVASGQSDAANLPMKLPPGLGNPSSLPQAQANVVSGLPLARAYPMKSLRRAAKTKKNPHSKRHAKPQKGPNP